MLELKEVIQDSKLEDYPDLIAACEKEIQALEMELVPYEKELWRKDSEIESQISELKEKLTNDSLRKAYRREAQQAFEYQKVVIWITDRRNEIEAVRIDLRLIENKFTVAKIKERQQTADIELQAARLRMG